MAHMIEERNGVYSFAENGKRERAWHGLGDKSQIFDRPMYVTEALEACHANYNVNLQPVIAISPEIQRLIERGEMIDPNMLSKLIMPKAKATMRIDHNEALGLVSDKYGIVQNADAFRFVDLFCSGKFADRDIRKWFFFQEIKKRNLLEQVASRGTYFKDGLLDWLLDWFLARLLDRCPYKVSL